jgi:1,4-dihydroxy-2-naphthoate octaprenyltransferase
MEHFAGGNILILDSVPPGAAHPAPFRSNGTLFTGQDLEAAMKALQWIRASQAILFEASLAPAFVGTAAAIRAGARFDGLWFGLILLSLVGVQAGANLFKGYFEARDRVGPPAAPGSWFAFDSSAAADLGRGPRSVLRVGSACFLLGALAGLVLVVLSRNPVLIAFGLAGALLAWSYSSPPLKLSYRGIGELSTFMAFGPIMTVGATVAFGGAGLRDSVFASIVLGFLASAISFARYFPNREEDVAKGKRTPVTLLGLGTARILFFGVLFAPLVIGILWIALGGGVLWFAALLLGAPLLVHGFPANASPKGLERVIASTIAAHGVVAASLVIDLLVGL